MGNKEIQSERLQRYFLDSAKNIIKSEGIEALTVRSIADNAGYSYGTLYNYYKDVKELVFQSGLEFVDECKQYVLACQYSGGDTKEEIKLKAKKYTEYFVQYVGIYQLLFITSKNEIGNFPQYSKAVSDMNHEIFGNNFKSLFGDNAESMLSMFVNLIAGNLLMYINRHQPEDYLVFRNSLEYQIDTFLNINF